MRSSHFELGIGLVEVGCLVVLLPVRAVSLHAAKNRDSVEDLVDRAAYRAANLLGLPLQVAPALGTDEQPPEVGRFLPTNFAAVVAGEIGLASPAEPGCPAQMNVRGVHVARLRLSVARC
jgi:hypothetical protein